MGTLTRRATARGADRPSLGGSAADVIIAGASFAGLAVARELALAKPGTPAARAEVLLLDRYEVGERATSACAAPTGWLQAMGVEDSIRQEIPCMAFHTPRGRVRYRLPWSWSAFDYRHLCELLLGQTRARFETATVHGGSGATVETDRGGVSAPLIVDALGWRRVLGRRSYQPPDAPLSRGLEVHPNGGGVDLDVWIDRSLVRRGYCWSVPAATEQRVGAGSYEPRRDVKRPTIDLARDLGREPVRYQGNWFPHRLRSATEDGVFFVGDSAGHCFPLSGEGIRTAFYFGTACGRELRTVLDGEATAGEALARYARFSDSHRRAFRLALGLQRLVPALPPRLLTYLLRGMSNQRVIDRAFGWYLAQAHPAYAAEGPAWRGASKPPQPCRSARRSASASSAWRAARSRRSKGSGRTRPLS